MAKKGRECEREIIESVPVVGDVSQTYIHTYIQISI